jgi:hypothetical protein
MIMRVLSGLLLVVLVAPSSAALTLSERDRHDALMECVVATSNRGVCTCELKEIEATVSDEDFRAFKRARYMRRPIPAEIMVKLFAARDHCVHMDDD